MSGGFDTLYQLVAVVTSMCVAATVLLSLPDGRTLMFAEERRVSRPGLAVLSVFALALVVRFVLPPHSLFHDHNHGYRYLQVMFDTGPHNYRLEYGVGGFNVFRLFLRVLPETPGSVFGLNAVFGALTVLPVYALARGLWHSHRAGLFAAAVIAVLPPHVRLSGTEDLYVLAGLFEATSLAALVAYMRGGRARHLALAVVAAVVCVSVRETMNLVPILCVAFALGLQPGLRQRLDDRRLWLAAVGAVIAGLPHIVFFARYSLADFGAQSPNFDAAWIVDAGRQMVSTYNVYLDPAVTLPTVGLLVIAGSLLGFRDHRREILLVWAALFAFMYVAHFKSLTDSDRVMFHAHYGIYVAVLAGRGAAQVIARLSARVAPVAVSVAVAAAIGVVPITALSFLRSVSNIQIEFDCIERHAAQVPDGCTLVTLRNGEDTGQEPIAADLESLPTLRGRRVIGVGAYLQHPRPGAGCFVYYEQRICAEPTMDEVFQFCGLDADRARYPAMLACIRRYRRAHPEAYQAACTRLRRERRLEPLGTCRFDAAPLDVDPMVRGRRLELGFYRLRPATPPDAERPDTPSRSDPDPRR